MANTRFDICTPRKSRDGKTFWTKVGTAWQSEKGIQLVFDALPLPDAEGRCVANLFEPKPRDGSQGAPLEQARQHFPAAQYADDDSDSIPFVRNDTAW